MSIGVQNEEIDDGSARSGRRGGSGDRDDAFTATFIYGGETRELRVHDPVEEGRKILRSAGLEPPSEYVLIQLQKPGSRSIGQDEEFDFRAAGHPTFRAFLSDRIFTFTVAERGYEWGAPKINGLDLYGVAVVPEDSDLVLEREDEPDLVIKRTGELDLSERGVEHLRIRKRPDSFEVSVIYNGQRKPLVVTQHEKISEVLARAITLFGPLPNPHTLSLHTADTGELKDEWTVKQAGLTPGEKVLLRPSTVKAG